MKYKQGQKYIAITDGAWYTEGAVAVCTQDSNHLLALDLKPIGTKTVLQSNWIPYVGPVLTVEVAKANLEKAKAYLKVAEETERKSKVFTEADVKNLMVVYFPIDRQLRLVVIDNSRVTFQSPCGVRVGYCHISELVSDLNDTYEKNNQNIKGLCR